MRRLVIPSDLLDLQVFLAADGSQIEVRALAEIARDRLLIRQFQEAAVDRHNHLKDIHCQVGNMLTGWPVERIWKEKAVRKAVKNLHFGIIFGKARDGIYDYIVMKIRQIEGRQAVERFMKEVTREQVEGWYDHYFKVYSGVAQYVSSAQHQADTKHYVETLFGFRREIRKDDDTRGSFWGNQAINSPVQGTAHGFILIIMALLDLKPRTYSLLQNCLMEVHDALYFRVRLRHLVEAYKQLMGLFENEAYAYAQKQFGLRLRVPLLAEASAGFTMASMIEYEGAPLEEFLPAWRKKQQEVDARSWRELSLEAA